MTASSAGGRNRQRARIAIIGSGWWASEFHIPAVLGHPSAELVAIVDPDERRRAAAAGHFDLKRAYPDVDTLLDAESLDGVIVATPSASHFEIARKALSAGLHVLVEKPLTLRAAEAWELVHLADQGGRYLTVGYTYQHTEAALRAAEVMSEGSLGRIINVSSAFSSSVESYLRGRPDDYRSKRSFRLTTPLPDTYSSIAQGGGQTYAQSTHVAAMICRVSGLTPQSVFAYLNYQGLQVDLALSAVIRFGTGASGSISSTGTVPYGQPKQQCISYYCTDGYGIQDLVTGSAEFYYSDGRREKVAAQDSYAAYPQLRPAQHLCDLISGATKRNPADGRSAAQAVEIVEAIHLSANSGNPVPIPPRPYPDEILLSSRQKES